MDSPSLTDRLRDNPTPAVVWVLGLCLLLGAELSSIAGALVDAGGSVANGLDSVFGAITVDAVTAGDPTALLILGTLALLFLGVGLAVVPRVPFSLSRRIGEHLSYERRMLLDAVIVAVALGLVATVSIWAGLVDLLRVGGSPLWTGLEWLAERPNLTSRELIPNEGYQVADGTWHGTFLGLSPAVAWTLRVLVVFAYVGLWLGWLWAGYWWYRTHYRQADWTPRDDMVQRLRTHRWGQFGMVVVCLFLTMAVFAPSLGTTTAEADIYAPFSHTIEYFDDSSGEVETITVGEANQQTRSVGYEAENVGPLSYDQFDRFHPFGTLTDGKDLLTFLVHGARVSLLIGLLSVGLSAAFATMFALISAYYRGLADLVLVITGDTIMGVPRLLLLILLTVLFAETWLGSIYDGGVLLAVILAGTGWPYLWRSFRGPTLQISEEEWVDAARSYGQTPIGIMRLHMLPYLVGYLLIYSSLVLGGVILAIAGLSFLGLGITAPTPEWGRAVDLGREYVATTSWHISLIPGLLITLVVTGFNALGDGLRDAIDPKADGDIATDTESQSRGGGV